MAARGKTLEIRTSPHIVSGYSVDTIMFNVVLALAPCTLFAVYAFGLAGLLTLATAVGSCLLTEHLICSWSGRRTTVGDWSVTITGLLYGLTLPPCLPLWMVAVGGAIAVGLGKALFGGLGYNVMNPALVGRAFVQAAFPTAITSWTPAFAPSRFTTFIPSTFTPPFTAPPALQGWIHQAAVDGFTGATPLALQKFQHQLTDVWSLFLGTTAGSAGEGPAALILVCGAYLAARRMMDWKIPIAVLAGAGATSGAFHLADPGRFPEPLFMLFSGGLMLGAVFMASDMVASPVTPLGVWIYGLLIGFVSIIIRLFGGLPEGVMYAILLGNALCPLIDAVSQPRVYGTSRRIRGP